MFIIDLFTFTGGIVCAVVLAYILQGIISWIVKKIKDILSRQCKRRKIMRLSIKLTKEEMKRLEEGGFISMTFKNGVRIIVKKDSSDKKSNSK